MSNADFEFSPRPQDCTEELQAAINNCAENGSKLILKSGIHNCAGLNLKSNLHLHFEDGAVLHLATGYDHYANNEVSVIAEDSDRAMIKVSGEKNISITGKGIIEAHGEAYITGELVEMGTHIPAALRPRTLVVEHSQGLKFRDFLIKNSPMWTIHLICSDDISFENVRVDNDRKMPNTDGIVVDACENVEIRNCDIATADDGIVLKTSAKKGSFEAVGVCRDILAVNCNIESHSCALKIGTESFGDFDNIIFRDCELTQSNRAVGIFSRDGGEVTNVIFERVSVDCHETPEGFWGCGEAITVNCIDRRKDRPAGKVENVSFIDISGRMEGAVNLVADGKAGINKVVLKNVSLLQELGQYDSGKYDVRPTHFDLEPSPDAAGRANAWIKDENGNVIGLVGYPDGQPGLFASNISGLMMENVEISRPDPLPQSWNKEPFVIVQDETKRW